MAGIIAVYSLVIAVLIAGDLGPPPGQSYSLFKLVSEEFPFPFLNTESLTWDSGFMHLAAGLSVGLTGLAAGYAIGVVGDMVNSRGICGICGRADSITGGKVIHAAVPNFCWHGSDLDFWRGAGVIRVCLNLYRLSHD